MTVLETLQQKAATYAEWRHDFHQHPELGLEEVRTAGIVAEKLRSWGIEVTEKVGVTGVVGVIRGSLGPGKTIGLRADMDALAMTETGTCPWKSVNVGVMHGCGHDGHTTMLLAAAEYLAAHRDFHGTVILIFQPAEEGNGGARAMLADGLFERFPMDEIFGMHNAAEVRPGYFTGLKGAAMAGSDFFTIRVKGKGAHGSAPQNSVDATLTAAMIVTSLQQIVARNVAPLDSAVVSVTKNHAGSAFNVIPQDAELGGCTRFFSEKTGAMLRSRIEAVSKAVAESCGATAEVEFNSIYSVLENDAELTDAMMNAAREVVGPENVGYASAPRMGSEDFSFLSQRVRGAYCFLGGQAPHSVKNHHNPGYDFDDRILHVGAAIWVKLVEQRLG
ncbi:amidohydrolase [Sutterella sp.]|uniref:amidohydrolase n=1 Tax=Sutterella sp. TaxID=1981025 RepID=UPI0026E0E725|nr:amidohydrolase [Sutterella sp.]MDO5532063.1 amidohydrolase [Sutterella sp.]